MDELTVNERIVVDDTLAYILDRARAWGVPMNANSGPVRAALEAWVIASRAA